MSVTHNTVAEEGTRKVLGHFVDAPTIHGIWGSVDKSDPTYETKCSHCSIGCHRCSLPLPARALPRVCSSCCVLSALVQILVWQPILYWSTGRNTYDKNHGSTVSQLSRSFYFVTWANSLWRVILAWAISCYMLYIQQGMSVPNLHSHPWQHSKLENCHQCHSSI